MNYLEQIKAWASKRGIYDIPFNPIAQLGFIAEEKHEFLTAKSDNERIDALCDMTVFAVNAIYTLDPDYEISTKWCNEYYGGLNSENLFMIVNIVSEHEAKIGYAFYHEEKTKFCFLFECLIKDCRQAIELLDYDYDKAMQETLKEINNRVGYFDESRGKWVKTETKYKADYELTKIKKPLK